MLVAFSDMEPHHMIRYALTYNARRHWRLKVFCVSCIWNICLQMFIFQPPCRS